jgi:hypothetical protein
MDFKKKYFKYKLKYLNLKKQTGGSWYYREYTEKEKIDYANLLPYTKKINYQNYNLTLNIVQPNTMNKRIRNIAYPAKFEGSSPSDGHSHAKEELLRKDENSIGYGVLILLGNDPIYYVTLRVFPQYKFCLPMGVTKNINVDININKGSFLLHSFWASFVKEKYSDVEYVFVPPVGPMLHNFLKNMKYDDNQMIPIGTGFLGDLEFQFETSKYKEMQIEKYKNYRKYNKEKFKSNNEVNKNKYKYINQFLSHKDIDITISEDNPILTEKMIEDYIKVHEPEVKRELDNQILSIKKFWNFEKVKFKDNAEELKSIETYEEDEKNEIKYIYTNKIKNKINNIKRSLEREEEFREGNLSDNQITEEEMIYKLNKINETKTMKKIKEFRPNFQNDLIYPNPSDIEYIEDDGKVKRMIKIKYSDDKKIIMEFSQFYECFTKFNNTNNYSFAGIKSFWNNSPLITIRVDDLNKKWNEYNK